MRLEEGGDLVGPVERGDAPEGAGQRGVHDRGAGLAALGVVRVEAVGEVAPRVAARGRSRRGLHRQGDVEEVLQFDGVGQRKVEHGASRFGRRRARAEALEHRLFVVVELERAIQGRELRDRVVGRVRRAEDELEDGGAVLGRQPLGRRVGLEGVVARARFLADGGVVEEERRHRRDDLAAELARQVRVGRARVPAERAEMRGHERLGERVEGALEPQPRGLVGGLGVVFGHERLRDGEADRDDDGRDGLGLLGGEGAEDLEEGRRVDDARLGERGGVRK
mmetsp:Transcript_8511/g.35011  ORF Transcript_8511/g.35011 Transcript_8511/m.35011 type:complete len:280 (-) Transcript_8511:2001-2840(-)